MITRYSNPARRITYSNPVSPDLRALALPLADAKKHLRVTGDEENDLIESLIRAATDWCETYQGRRYVQGIVTDYWTGFPCGEMPLRWAPLPLTGHGDLTHQSVSYYDTNGDLQTLVRDTDFLVIYHAVPPYLTPMPGGVWPSDVQERDDAVRVSYIAGSDSVPVKALQAIRVGVGDMYRNREESISEKTEKAMKRILGPNRLIAMA